MREGKQTKVPYMPYVPTPEWLASTTDPSTWSSFEDVLQAAPRFDGIGFVFNNDYTGVDLDKAFDNEGHMKTWAREIVSNCPTYAERSPSGKGVHLISLGKLPDGWTGTKRSFEDGAVEIYSRARYFTFTGDLLPTSPANIVDQNDFIRELYQKIRGSKDNGNANQATLTHIRPIFPIVN